jgi:hypothetical protein
MVTVIHINQPSGLALIAASALGYGNQKPAIKQGRQVHPSSSQQGQGAHVPLPEDNTSLEKDFLQGVLPWNDASDVLKKGSTYE